jgi:hypothetical protein
VAVSFIGGGNWRTRRTTTDLPLVTDNFYHIMLYHVHLVLNEIRTRNISGWWCLTTLSTIVQLYRDVQFYWWMKPEDLAKTTNLSKVIVKLYHIMLYTSPWSCKSNYHAIMATAAPDLYIVYMSKWVCCNKELTYALWRRKHNILARNKNVEQQ